MRKPNINRTGQRLMRLAYDLEALASKMREAGEDSAANSVRACASDLGNIGRDLDRRYQYGAGARRATA